MILYNVQTGVQVILLFETYDFTDMIELKLFVVGFKVSCDICVNPNRRVEVQNL